MTLFLGSSASLFAQCDAGQSQVVVEILTDNYPGEITWTLSDANGQLLSGGPYGSSGTTYTDSVCIAGADEFPCLQFVINDSYGMAFAVVTVKVRTRCSWMGWPWQLVATTASRTKFNSIVRQGNVQ